MRAQSDNYCYVVSDEGEVLEPYTCIKPTKTMTVVRGLETRVFESVDDTPLSANALKTVITGWNPNPSEPGEVFKCSAMVLNLINGTKQTGLPSRKRLHRTQNVTLEIPKGGFCARYVSADFLIYRKRLYELFGILKLHKIVVHCMAGPKSSQLQNDTDPLYVHYHKILTFALNSLLYLKYIPKSRVLDRANNLTRTFGFVGSGDNTLGVVELNKKLSGMGVEQTIYDKSGLNNYIEDLTKPTAVFHYNVTRPLNNSMYKGIKCKDSPTFGKTTCTIGGESDKLHNDKMYRAYFATPRSTLRSFLTNVDDEKPPSKSNLTPLIPIMEDYIKENFSGYEEVLSLITIVRDALNEVIKEMGVRKIKIKEYTNVDDSGTFVENYISGSNTQPSESAGTRERQQRSRAMAMAMARARLMLMARARARARERERTSTSTRTKTKMKRGPEPPNTQPSEPTTGTRQSKPSTMTSWEEVKNLGDDNSLLFVMPKLPDQDIFPPNTQPSTREIQSRTRTRTKQEPVNSFDDDSLFHIMPEVDVGRKRPRKETKKTKVFTTHSFENSPKRQKGTGTNNTNNIPTGNFFKDVANNVVVNNVNANDLDDGIPDDTNDTFDTFDGTEAIVNIPDDDDDTFNIPDDDTFNIPDDDDDTYIFGYGGLSPYGDSIDYDTYNDIFGYDDDVDIVSDNNNPGVEELLDDDDDDEASSNVDISNKYVTQTKIGANGVKKTWKEDIKIKFRYLGFENDKVVIGYTPLSETEEEDRESRELTESDYALGVLLVHVLHAYFDRGQSVFQAGVWNLLKLFGIVIKPYVFNEKRLDQTWTNFLERWISLVPNNKRKYYGNKSNVRLLKSLINE